MLLLQVEDVRNIIEAVITGASVLGGTIAYCSGSGAARAVAERQPPEVLARRVNEGVAEGFNLGLTLSAFTLIILVWS